MPLAGSSPDTCRIPVTSRCGSHPRQTLAGSSEIALGRAGADLGPTWGHLGANLSQLEPKFIDLGSKCTDLASKCWFWGLWILVFWSKNLKLILIFFFRFFSPSRCEALKAHAPPGACSASSCWLCAYVRGSGPPGTPHFFSKGGGSMLMLVRDLAP